MLVDAEQSFGEGFGVSPGFRGTSGTGGGPLRGPRKFSCELQNSV